LHEKLAIIVLLTCITLDDIIKTIKIRRNVKYISFERRKKMSRLSYTQHIQDLIADTAVGYPIFVSELGKKLAVEYNLDEKKATAAAAVAVKRILDNNLVPALRCFKKGIYYLTKPTIFGETGINKETLIELKYISGDNGYETGPTIMHKLGLTSLMPAERMFVSNKALNRTIRDEALNITVKTPKITVNKDNKLYLQLLDLLNIYDEVPVDSEQPYHIISNLIATSCLDYKILLAIADQYYGNDTVIRLAHVASIGGMKI